MSHSSAPLDMNSLRKYCCICSGIYRGKEINGRVVSSHRFPQNSCLRRVWIQRCRTVMYFQWNKHKLLCSEHFVDRKGPSLIHTLPSIFPTAKGGEKIFPTSVLDENQQVPEEDEFQGEPYIATPVNIQPYLEILGATEDTIVYDEGGMSFVQEGNLSNLDVSLSLHDYINGPVPTPSSIRMIETQTCSITTSTVDTQTDSSVLFRSVGTQTELCQKDCDEQTNLPTLVYEDVMNNSKKLNFYSGIPSKGIFNALFDEMQDTIKQLMIKTFRIPVKICITR